jgi:hypothetical protein
MFVEIQLIGIAYGIGMFYFLYTSWRRKELTKGDFYIWSLAWLGFVFALIFPGIFTTVRHFLGISGGPVPFFTIFGFMFITGIVFYLYQRVRINSRKIEKLVREIAINRVK